MYKRATYNTDMFFIL